MSDSQAQQPPQSIFRNVSAENITTGKITQIYKTYVNLDRIPKPQGIPQNIIFSSTDKFVGRERELESLSQQLQSHDEVVIAAVEGMGGVGKTELAIQYSLLNLQLDTYPGGICWLRSREEDLGLQIINFARTDLDLNPPDDLELPDRVRWCWKRWREGNALIIFDDVKDYSDIKPYLPPQPSRFKVLITTRLKLDLPSSLYLAVLTESDALELLRQLIGQEKVEQELEIAQELCQRLGYLPLALQLVGRYIKQRDISLDEELRRLEEKGLGHSSMGVPENDHTWTLNIKNGVKAAFELSWSELSETAQELGCALSLFALAPIPWSLVESAAVEQDTEELEDARVELENLHLLQGQDTYQLHQLIREFFGTKQTALTIADEQKYNFCSAMIEVARKIPQTPTFQEINNFSPFIPHLAEAINLHQNWLRNDDLVLPFRGLSYFYTGQGFYVSALPWLEQCVSVTRERLGEENSDTAQSLNNLAFLYKLLNRYAESEPLYLQALEIRKRIWGGEHFDVATSLNNLAELYRVQGQYIKAEPLHLQALEMRKRIWRGEHLDVAISLNNLAILYHAQGRYIEAESLHLQDLELSKRLLGEDHPHVASSLSNLQGLYKSQGRYKEAEPLCQHSLEMRKRIFGEDHPHVATSLNNLAQLYITQGKYSEAEPLHLKALEMRKRFLGNEHSDVANSLNNLAALYCIQNKHMEAEPLYLEALNIMKRLLGQENVFVAHILNNLAGLCFDQKQYEKAEPQYLEALKLRKRLLGEQHPDVVTSLSKLAKLYFDQGRYEEAEPRYLEVLTIAEQVLGENHPTTNKIRANYERLKER
jgi:tetratricopeptide (TPR) repeat protein